MSNDWQTEENSFEKRLAEAPGCPFCGSHGVKVDSWWHHKKLNHRHGSKSYVVICQMCGANSAQAETEELALINWESRTQSGYHPLGEHTYILPGIQKFSHVMVHADGKVTLIDYIEEETMPNGIAAKMEIDLGRFRLCRWVREIDHAGK